jgi:hypothetical protein
LVFGAAGLGLAVLYLALLRFAPPALTGNAVANTVVVIAWPASLALMADIDGTAYGLQAIAAGANGLLYALAGALVGLGRTGSRLWWVLAAAIGAAAVWIGLVV